MRLQALVTTTALLSALALAPPRAHADTIELSSQANNTDTFDLLLSGAPVTFNTGSTITISGLSSVSGLNYLGASSYFGTLSSTSTSVIFQFSSPQTFAGGAASDLPIFSINKPGSPVQGHATYVIQESTINLTGPVAATPEPASLLLLGTGLLGGAGAAARKRHRPCPPRAAVALA